MISHLQAIEIIADHGWNPTDQTAIYVNDPTQEIEGTSFYDELGIEREYSLQDVKFWLGY